MLYLFQDLNNKKYIIYDVDPETETLLACICSEGKKAWIDNFTTIINTENVQTPYCNTISDLTKYAENFGCNLRLVLKDFTLPVPVDEHPEIFI